MIEILIDGELKAKTNQPEIAIEWLVEIGLTRATAWNMVFQAIRNNKPVCNTMRGKKICVNHK